MSLIVDVNGKPRKSVLENFTGEHKNALMEMSAHIN